MRRDNDRSRSGQPSVTGEGEKLRSQRARADWTMNWEESVRGRGAMERPRLQVTIGQRFPPNAL